MFPWVQVDGLRATKRGVGLSVLSLSFQDSILCDSDPPTSQTDRQTDGRTDDMQSQYRALHYSASPGNNTEFIKHTYSQ